MELSRRAALMGLILAGLPLPLAAKGEVRLSGRAFGGSWTVLARDLRDPKASARAIAARLAVIDAEMSPYRKDSALARFNTGAVAVAIGADLEQVLGAALATAQASAGAYDPTIGPIVHRYGFGPIADGRHRPGLWAQIDCTAGKLTGPPEATLDLCGIAKGFAVDAVFALLSAQSRDFVVEIGGEIRAAGDWPIGIADPRGGVSRRVTLRDGALATSGDGVQGFDHGGRRWGHIIDPRQQIPLRGDLASVSVAAPTAMAADVMATAIMVMGEGAGLELAAQAGLGVLCLRREGTDLVAQSNAAFERLTI